MKTQTPTESTTQTPSADATIYKFPAAMRMILLGAGYLCIGFTALVFAMQMLRPSRNSWVLVLLTFLLCGPAAIYCLGAYRRFRDRIAVDTKGIWYLAKDGGSTFIAWADIANVTANDTMQRLILTDASGTRIIRAEYQLENFANLREFILAHRSGASRSPVSVSLFHRSWINKIVFSVFGVLALLLAGGNYRQRSDCAFAVLVGALFLLLVMLDPLSLAITQEGIIIRYPAWTRKIPFESITGVSLKDVKDARNGNVWAAVVIERRKGRRIRLFRFREGSIALSEALRSAWTASRENRDQTDRGLRSDRLSGIEPSL